MGDKIPDAKPFVKWAGGKGKMLPHIVPALPEKMDVFYEPFVGAGAVFFELARQKRFKKAVLCDSNADLMSSYRAIQTDVEGLIEELSSKRYKYESKTYYKIRGESPSDEDVKRAARFIYLNKTCFNGLYRVNRAGEFNTPFGKFENPTICDAENLRAVSKILKKVVLRETDYEEVVMKAKEGDGIYFDPPYLPISETASFTGYTPGGFNGSDHAKLAYVFKGLAGKGVRVVLSNSLCNETRELYSGFEVKELMGARNVGGPAEYRKPVMEMMVVGGPSPSGAQSV